MGFGNMQKKIKQSKNIKIYNKNHLSFKQLRDKDFFRFFYMNQAQFMKPLIETLISFVKEFNAQDVVDKKYIEDLLEEHYDLVEISYDVSLPEQIKKEMISQIFSIYKEGYQKYNDFRGEIVEYLIFYLEKDNQHKLFHEPTFYYKREKLFKVAFVGSECLIDLVKLNKRKHDITLIECKANLDIRIKNLGDKKDKFKNKLALMDALKNRLESYINFYGQNIHVKKVLATINYPQRNLPNKYKNYHFVDLFDRFKRIN